MKTEKTKKLQHKQYEMILQALCTSIMLAIYLGHYWDC